jgi:cell division transport system permease protein
MISRNLKEGFNGVGRHFAMAVSSAIAVTVTLLLISIFALFMLNVSHFTHNVEQGMEIGVMIDYNYESDEQEQAIKEQIEALDGIESITYYTKEEEKQYFLDQLADNPELQQSYEKILGDENPMHDSFYVTVTDGSILASTAEKISQIEGVARIEYGGSSTTMMVKAMTTVRRVGSLLVLALTILAVFLIQNTIKLTIYARQDEISIERSVGATNHFIRAPFVVEGAIIGVMGSIIPILLTVFGYRYLYNRTGGYVISVMFHLIKPLPLLLYVSGGLLIIGILVGLVGSYLSVTRYLKWKR